MSQVTWLRGPLCGVDNCRSRLYRSSAGRKICQFGHVMEGNLEIDEDDGESYSQTRRLNIRITDTGFGSQTASSASSLAPVVNSRRDNRLYGLEGRHFQFKCLQYLLQVIAPRVCRYLYKSLEETSLISLISSSSAITKLLWIRCVKKVYSKVSPTIVDLYAIVYLSLRELNMYPVFVDDYLEMLRENRVPFINAVNLLPEHMRRIIPSSSSGVFSVVSIPIDNTFYRGLAKWSRTLSLQDVNATPCSYFYPLAFRVFSSLNIPQAPELLVVFHELALRITGGTFKHDRGSVNTFPEVQAIGLIYYALRLYLSASPKIIDKTLCLQSLTTYNGSLPCFKDSKHHMDLEDIMSLSNDQITEYFDWVYDSVVSERYKETDRDELTVMNKKLGKIFSYLKEESSEQKRNDTYFNAVVSVPNELSTAELAELDFQLSSYFSNRFGIGEALLRKLHDRIEAKVYKRFSGVRHKERDG